MKRLRLLFALVVLALCAQALAQAPASPGGYGPWRVVLIRNWDALYPVNIVREQALREALLAGAPRVIEIYPEQIDPLRFPGELEPQLVSLLQRKYSATKVDVVIATGVEALDFATRNRDRVWPAAAIVFNGVLEGTLKDWKRPPRTTGVLQILDVPGTLAVGRALVPNARKVYLIAGNAAFDRAYLDLALERMRAAKEPLEPQFLVGLPLEEILERVAKLEPDSLVMYLTMLRDGKGQYAAPVGDTVTRISRASRAPVLVAAHTLQGRGPVGGSAGHVDKHGRAAGEIVRSLLEGTDPDSIEIRAEPQAVCQVDWRALRRWGIPESRVPARCEITNVVEPAWRTYWWQLAVLLAVIVVQAALLWALAMQSARRRRAEEQLQTKTAEMAQVARISTMGALTASIAHEINQPMGAILSNAEAARMMLDQGTLDDQKLRAILTDIRDEDLRASGVIRGLRALLARHEYKPVALEVNTEVAQALRHVAFEAARRGLRLSPVFGTGLPMVMGDSIQLQQVVINLALNAMEAVSTMTEHPEIRIETRAGDGGAEIVVIDRGPGIPSEVVPRLFQGTHTTKKDGMGFGLSIVKTIVEMHRGRVAYEPNVPSGAIFRVWLPAIGA